MRAKRRGAQQQIAKPQETTQRRAMEARRVRPAGSKPRSVRPTGAEPATAKPRSAKPQSAKPQSSKPPETTFRLAGEYIALDNLLKITGVAPSGGAAKAMAAAGVVKVDGAVELRKTCKIRAGQLVEMTKMETSGAVTAGARIRVLATEE